ncbi:hypothetical protein ASZ78_001565, partial [Callipepla squamata]
GRGGGAAALRAGAQPFCAVSDVQAACRGSVVSQELLKEGFHRELLLKAELDAAGRPEGGCAVAARARLPSGLYVDPYELASLQRRNVTKEDEELILQVPVGRAQHSFLVCVVTLLATVLCSGLILAAVCKHGDFSLLTCLE